MDLIDLTKALGEFGLDQAMFDSMSKADLEVFVKSALACNFTQSKKIYSIELLKAKGLDFSSKNKSKTKQKKQVRISEPKARARSSSIEYNSLAPTSQCIDLLFDSLVTTSSINTFI
jgi:hypothetical protein